MKDAGETADEFLILLVTKFALGGQPRQMTRRVGMVRIVNEIVICAVGRLRPVVFVNEDGVIDVHYWVVGQIGDEKFSAGESLLELVVGFFLVLFAVLVEHSCISQAQIDHPAEADVPLHQIRSVLAKLA